MSNLYLSLGSNIGNRESNLESALKLIGLKVGTVMEVSDIIETVPWGFESQNSFLNMAVKVQTELEPLEVLHRTQEIEHMLGRTEKTVNGQYHDRPIDIDLLMYDSLIMDSPELTLPHPLMWQRQFVTQPLRQIAPELFN